MVASIRNISARSVIIGQIPPPPPPPPGIVLKSTQASMAHWATYAADYPTVIEAGGTFDPATLGSSGTLSIGNTSVDFSNGSSVLSTATLPEGGGPVACEFVINVPYNTYVGMWQLGYDTPPGYNANVDITAGGGFPGYYRKSNGDIYGYSGATGEPYVQGDIIGIIVVGTTSMHAYRNGVYQGTAGLVGGASAGYMMASASF